MFVQGSIQFIRNNIFSILLMVLVLFLTTSFFVMHNIIFPKSSILISYLIKISRNINSIIKSSKAENLNELEKEFENEICRFFDGEDCPCEEEKEK